MKKITILAAGLLCWFTASTQSLYDIDNITLIEIEFQETNWDELMDTHYENDPGERLIGTCTLNGQFYDSVGVAFKGNSTYNPSNQKNPLSIKLNHILDQKFQGYTSLKLSNGAKDPSFVREVLSYEIGRNYMDMPLANYAKVTINGDYYGLFSSVESINNDYHERRLYCDDDNTRFKCNPEVVFAGGSSLEYLGADSSDYYEYYELKSDFGWQDLVDFTRDLEFDPENIEEYLDVDRALWMLAFNSVLVNLDSYTGPFKQNYYLIKDDNDRFLPIIWDLNQSFGSFSMIEGGGGPGGTDLEDLTDMDLFLREDDPSFPLIQQLFSVPRYRKMYVAHVKTMVEENFASGDYYTRAEEIQSVIQAEVAAEPNGFYTPAQFAANLYETEGGGGPGPGGAGIFGISEVMNPRVDYLEGLAEWSYTTPGISDIAVSPEAIFPYATITVTASIADANYAYVGYRNDWQDAFTKIEMLDDGVHGDGAAGDGVFGAFVEMTARDGHYYIYAENAQAGKFSPERAEHEFYDLIIQSDVVINELMPLNNVSVTDPDGDYDDWIELYNTSGASIDLSGYYLSDRPNSDPLMWQFPDGTIIGANDYLIVWADEDTLEEGLHANFKLSASGEMVVLSDPGGFDLNKVQYPEMSSGTTYGRYPNGTGPLMRMFPTHAAENGYTALSIDGEDQEFVLKVYPNPADNWVALQFSSEGKESIAIYDIRGQRVYQNRIASGEMVDLSYLESGFYFIVFSDKAVSQKLVVH